MATNVTYKNNSLTSFNSGTKILKTAGKYMEDDVTIATSAGSTTTPATSITANPSISINTSTGLITATTNASQNITPTVTAGFVSAGTAGTVTVSGSNTEQLTTAAGATIQPTTSEQVAVAANTYTLGQIKVGAIPTTTLTNSIINGQAYEETTGDYAWRTTVTIPAGYHNAGTITKDFSTILPAPATEGTAGQVLIGYDLYDHTGKLISGTMTNNNSYSITLDDTTTSATIPAGYHDGTGTASHTTVAVPNPTISVNSSTGLITASGSWTKGFTTNNSYSNTSQLSVQAGTTITPTESQQTAVAAGKYTTGAVNVGAISSTYVGSGIDRRTSTDVTGAGGGGDYIVTIPAGYYSSAVSKYVPNGGTGTPTATKGTVSNHSISVTPSVTNTSGYITGGTRTGTAVTVSASELVSGTLNITANNTYDVTNYASAQVTIDFVTYYTGITAPSNSQGSNGDLYLQTED